MTTTNEYALPLCAEPVCRFILEVAAPWMKPYFTVDQEFFLQPVTDDSFDDDDDLERFYEENGHWCCHGYKIRTPLNEKFYDGPLAFPPDEFTERLGASGWNYVQQLSIWGGVDYDLKGGHHGEGCTPEKLKEVWEAATAAGCFLIVLSRSNKFAGTAEPWKGGFHLYLKLATPLPAPSRAQHLQNILAAFRAVEKEVGFDFLSAADHKGDILFFYHWRKQPGTLEPIHEPTRPAPEVDPESIVVASSPSGQQEWASRSGNTESSRCGESTSDAGIIDEAVLSPAQRAFKNDLEERGGIWSKGGRLDVYTHVLKHYLTEKGLLGDFDTFSTGKDGTKPNAYLYFSCDGVHARVYRYGDVRGEPSMESSWQKPSNADQMPYAEIRVVPYSEEAMLQTDAVGCVEENDDDPHRLARLCLDTHWDHSDGHTLVRWAGEWFQWDRMFWKPASAEQIKVRVTQTVKAEFDRIAKQGRKKAVKVTKNVVSNVLEALMSLVFLPSDLSAPAWLPDGEATSDYLIADNGIVCMAALLNGEKFLQPHSPRFFSMMPLEYSIETPFKDPEKWLAFLDEIWGDDPECIATLQEWFGYCLVPDTSQQKILLIKGPRRSGKGTIARVLTRVVGPRQVVSPTLNSLAGNFGLQPLLHKTLAIVNDARLDSRRSLVATERLLMISGEDAVTVERKYISAVTQKLTTRFMLNTNELPRFADASGAMAGRCIILPMTKSFYDQEDTELTDKLLTELPGIFGWSLEGLRRVRRSGRISEPKSGKEMRQQLQRLASPVSAFVDDCCIVGPEQQVGKDELYQAYVDWCETNGINYHAQKEVFGRDLNSLLPELKVVQPRSDGGRPRRYRGIGLKT